MVQDGKLTRFLDSKSVEKILLRFYLSGEEEETSLLKKLIGRIGGRKQDAK